METKHKKTKAQLKMANHMTVSLAPIVSALLFSLFILGGAQKEYI